MPTSTTKRPPGRPSKGRSAILHCRCGPDVKRRLVDEAEVNGVSTADMLDSILRRRYKLKRPGTS